MLGQGLGDLAHLHVSFEIEHSLLVTHFVDQILKQRLLWPEAIAIEFHVRVLAQNCGDYEVEEISAFAVCHPRKNADLYIF